MYVRYVTAHIDPYTGAECGFFQSSYLLDRRGCAQWIKDELRAQFDWFNHHLDVPHRLGRHFKRRESIWGICWFTPEALEAIERARYCAWLIGEGGLPVRQIKARIGREIIWRDPQQIVVKATPDLPKAFAR
ncbi:hypothetical protein [Asticcacaulis sp. YBE204]|uniref:hypothetical protein n=1 Tax=Asticcacaulis sp. YBE204 TaxID=1282363 RepID=UPI0003C3FE74|nr:hypothetical protein [Asticcacaulis sp. YBE204]ESQ80656.1 hypothetical protein AEYBE204_05135 [Asticcacaulis sp. YBE204]